MPEADPLTRLDQAIRDSGSVETGERGLVMVSGGADSMCLLTGLTRRLGAENLIALHVNYGLREAADQDQELVREACAALGVELSTLAAGTPAGNVQAWARDLRHGEAERIRSERELDWTAVGHTRTDLAETLIYRLASSPGVRPLLAMPARSGHLVRPLLGLGRGEVREIAEVAGISFADDATNEDFSFARNRIRHQVLPVLEGINPSVELNISRTRAELEEDEELLTRLAGEGWDPRSDEHLPGPLLKESHPAVRRRMLRLLAERELGRPVAIPPEVAVEALRLCARPEGGELDLGGGASLLIESGSVRVGAGPPPDAPAPVSVDLAGGEARFGLWEISCAEIPAAAARARFGEPDAAFLDMKKLAAAGPSLAIRARRPGDRVAPLGMGGTKSLQDAVIDAGVPRSERSGLPVLVAGDEVAWVPGVVVSERFRLDAASDSAVALRATSSTRSMPGA